MQKALAVFSGDVEMALLILRLLSKWGMKTQALWSAGRGLFLCKRRDLGDEPGENGGPEHKFGSTG